MKMTVFFPTDAQFLTRLCPPHLLWSSPQLAPGDSCSSFSTLILPISVVLWVLRVPAVALGDPGIGVRSSGSQQFCLVTPKRVC